MAVLTTKIKRSADTTIARKARRVLQSNGLHFFKTWADKVATGGRRKNGGHAAMKSILPSLYKELVNKGHRLNRAMDRPPLPKEKPSEE